MEVTSSDTSGFISESSGEMVLQDWSASFCGSHGVRCGGLHNTGGQVHVEGCIFKQNAECGVATQGDGTVVTVEGYHSIQHSYAGYCATKKAQMTMSSSTSQGDTRGCREGRAAHDGGGHCERHHQVRPRA